LEKPLNSPPMLRHAKYRALTNFLKEKQRHYDGLLPTAALYRRKSLPISPKRLTQVKVVCPPRGGERISRWPQFYAAQVRLAINRRQASWQWLFGWKPKLRRFGFQPNYRVPRSRKRKDRRGGRDSLLSTV